MGETVTCNGTCTLQLTVQPAPLTEEEVADYWEYFFLFFVALVALFFLRKTSDLFWNDHER